MTYSLEYTATALKQLKKLEKNTQTRILAALERCRIRPYTNIKKLVESPYFRLRIGDYRAILKIEDNKLIIAVLEIKHRKNVYK